MGGEVVADFAIQGLERIHACGDRSVVGIATGVNVVILAKPDFAAGIDHADVQAQMLTVGFFDAAENGEVDRVTQARHHAHATPVAHAAQHILHHVREIIRLGGANFFGNAFGLGGFVVLWHVLVEHRNADGQRHVVWRWCDCRWRRRGVNSTQRARHTSRQQLRQDQQQ